MSEGQLTPRETGDGQLLSQEAAQPDLILRRIALCISLIVAFTGYTIVCLLTPAQALRDPDTLWHIRTGRWILEQGRWPEADVFSHTFYGQPWIAKEWLSQLLLNAAYDVGGWLGVVILTLGVCAATCGVVA